MARFEEEEVMSSRNMRVLETNAEYFGISLLQLMENAGRSVAEEVISRSQKNQEIAVFCGLGGNGGDGFVAARHLLSKNVKVKVVLAGRGKDISHEAAKTNFSALKSLADIPVLEITDSSNVPKMDADIVVDALLGTGTKGKLKAPIIQMVESINSMTGLKIAVDVPTGIDSDTGALLGAAVKADVTITFHAAKTGLAFAKKYAGKVVVRDIGLPKVLERYAGPGDVLLVKQKRNSSAHKGDFGRLLVVGGSETFSGAPTLVSLAALRTGVDIVYVAAPEKTANAISSISPDLITIKLDGTHLSPSNLEQLKPYIATVDAVVIGPGLGLHPQTKEFVNECIKLVEMEKKSLLLDADGLKGFSEYKRPFRVPAVLTPHAGEYAILTNQNLPESLGERVANVQKTASDLNAVLLVKGRIDLTCSKDRVKLGFSGNPGMTVGGTGDVLSGVVGAFLAQKTEAFEAAVAGAFVNGAAGDFVASEIGYHIMASDLLKWIPYAIDDPMAHIKVRSHIGTEP